MISGGGAHSDIRGRGTQGHQGEGHTGISGEGHTVRSEGGRGTQ